MSQATNELQKEKVEFAAVDSLQKIFMKKEPLTCPCLYEISGMQGEHVSFQAAYRYMGAYFSSQTKIQATKNPSVQIEVHSELKEYVRIRKVQFVPSVYPAYWDADADYLTTEPGLFPDVLSDLHGSFQLIPYYWRSLWVEVDIPEEMQAGIYPLVLCMKDLEGKELQRITVKVQVIGCRLPKQTLMHTEWFHSDCLADYYQIPVFSEDYWKITENFMVNAVRRGINMILTPLFTLPLDVLIGRERTTVQLTQITRQNGEYSFDFSNFERWIALSKKCGFEYFEMSHLFSQWGARYAPKVVAWEDGEEKTIFGWETRADDPAYEDFLHQFLKALTGKLKELGIADKTYFHISDEPNEGNIDTYKAARELVKEDLKGFPVLDALSTLRFYEEGIVDCPVPANTKVHKFLDAGMKERWVYYCSEQSNDVSNRFFATPSCRNRILGVQMYLYDIHGFLHWGYNYYNCQYSLRHINPYIVTEAEDAFPSGDAFLVYPGEDGRPVESLRLLVLEEAVNDQRAFKKLEELKGREYVHTLIRDLAGMDITFHTYPHNAQFLIRLREKVNAEIAECLCK